MTFWVRFEGGTMGGREESFSKYPDHRIRYPVRRPVSFVSESGTLPSPSMDFDEYVYDRRTDDRTLVFRWRRPDIEGMRDRLNALLDERDDLKEALERCQDPRRRGLTRFAR
jgi:hypothetical protein